MSEESFAEDLESGFVQEEPADASTDASEPASSDEEVSAPSADETDVPETVADTGSKSEPPTSPPPGFVPVAAIQDERQKRQDAEIELARLRGREEARQPTEESAQEVEKVDFWDGPDEFLKSLTEDIPKQIATAVTASEQKAWDARATRCERRAAKAHDDYLEVKQQFLDRVKVDPVWAARVHGSEHFQDDPAEAIYQAEKSLVEQAAFDPDAERAKIRAEILAEQTGELVNADNSSLPKSQANSVGSGPKAEPANVDEGDAAFTGGVLPDY